MKITLSGPEIVMAATVGAMRYAESIGQQRKDAHGLSEDADGLCLHIQGAAGEMAAAKASQRYWGGDVGTFKKPDFGGNVQVRTRSQPGYDLIVREDDSDSDVFILVTGKVPIFDVVGWIVGAKAKKQEYVQSYGGRPAAWFVPQEALTLFR